MVALAKEGQRLRRRLFQPDQQQPRHQRLVPTSRIWEHWASDFVFSRVPLGRRKAHPENCSSNRTDCDHVKDRPVEGAYMGQCRYRQSMAASHRAGQCQYWAGDTRSLLHRSLVVRQPAHRIAFVLLADIFADRLQGSTVDVADTG